MRDGVGGMSGVTEYDAYGREVYSSGADRGDFRFAGAKGYANDDATGMHLLRHRADGILRKDSVRPREAGAGRQRSPYRNR